MSAVVRLNVANDALGPSRCPGAARAASEPAPAPPAGAWPEPSPARAAVGVAVRDWLDTQARVVEYWRDLLAEAGAEGADDDLVAALDAHAAFLHAAARRS